MNRILGDPELSAQYERMRAMVDGFRRGELDASEVFDAKRLGRLFGLVELLGHDHAAELDNLKFYYNPVTALIEPVGYDNQGLVDIGSFVEQRGSGETVGSLGLPVYSPTGFGRTIGTNQERSQLDGWYDALFSDPGFFKEYIRTLEEVSGDAYLTNFFVTIESQLRENLAILHKSYPWYKFDREVMFSNQEYIRRVLSPAQSYKCGVCRI